MGWFVLCSLGLVGLIVLSVIVSITASYVNGEQIEQRVVAATDSFRPEPGWRKINEMDFGPNPLCPWNECPARHIVWNIGSTVPTKGRIHALLREAGYREDGQGCNDYANFPEALGGSVPPSDKPHDYICTTSPMNDPGLKITIAIYQGGLPSYATPAEYLLHLDVQHSEKQ